MTSEDINGVEIWRMCKQNETKICFINNSSLRSYLLKNNRIKHTYYYKFNLIFDEFFGIIQEKHMLSKKSRGMIICDEELTSVLKMRGLQIFQIPSIINGHVFENKEASKLSKVCENAILRYKAKIKAKQMEIKDKWFKQKRESKIGISLKIDDEREIVSGAEIVEKIETHINAIDGLFEKNNRDVCILKGNTHSFAPFLSVTLQTDAFHKANLWEIVMKGFDDYNKPGTQKCKNKDFPRKSTFQSITSEKINVHYQASKVKSENENNNQKQLFCRIKIIITRIFTIIAIAYIIYTNKQ